MAFDRLKTTESLWSLWNLVCEAAIKWGLWAGILAVLSAIGAALYSAGAWINQFGVAGWVVAAASAIIGGAVLVGTVAWAQLQARVAWARRTSGGSEVSPNFAKMGLHLQGEIDRLKDQVFTADDKRDLLTLLSYTVYDSALLMLDTLLEAAPDGFRDSLDLHSDLAGKRTVSEEFVETVRRRVDPGSDRRSRFESAMWHAANEAEHAVEKTTPNERPAGIDPLVLRRQAIAYVQCRAAIGFLNRERREILENLLSQRSSVLERYSRKRGP